MKAKGERAGNGGKSRLGMRTGMNGTRHVRGMVSYEMISNDATNRPLVVCTPRVH